MKIENRPETPWAKSLGGLDKDVVIDWIEFWVPIIAPAGTLDLAQVARELFDYHVAIEQVATAYCDLTGNRFSKPNTRADYVIEAGYEHIEWPLRIRIAELEAALKKAEVARDAMMDEMYERLEQAEAALAEAIRLIRHLHANTGWEETARFLARAEEGNKDE